MKSKEDRAREQARYAVRSGRIRKAATCEACSTSDQTLVGHHHDYNLPLDVIWLCAPCHHAVHRGEIVEPRTGRLYTKQVDLISGRLRMKAPKRQARTVPTDEYEMPIDAMHLDDFTWDNVDVSRRTIREVRNELTLTVTRTYTLLPGPWDSAPPKPYRTQLIPKQKPARPSLCHEWWKPPSERSPEPTTEEIAAAQFVEYPE